MDLTRTRIREYRRCPEYADFFPTDQVSETGKFGNRTQKGSGHARWFGQDLSRAPDSGIGDSQDHRSQWADDDGVEQDSCHPMGSQWMGRKRRAGDRFVPSPYGDDVVHQKENRWDIPCKRALFGSNKPDSMTPSMDVVETQDHGPPGIGYPQIRIVHSLVAAWFPSQKLEDTVARLQRDITVYRKELRFAGEQGPANPPQSRGRSEFTSTPVPRYSGKSSWGQYRQVFAGIACSNGWSPTTAALQLFAHLDGEALNVALLMPVEERERWTSFVRGLSDYFNSPGRLAAVRRRFESASRRPGVDPATFAMELGVLAMQGFDNMGERACGLMIRNKFIAAQPSRALRRHLDGASAEASIGDIVDSCRVWESHAEDGYDGTGLEISAHHCPGGGGSPACLGVGSFGHVAEEQGTVIAVAGIAAPGGICESSDCELLIQRIIEAVRPGMDAPTLVPGLDGGINPSSPVPLEPVLEEDSPVWGGIGCVSPVVTRDMG